MPSQEKIEWVDQFKETVSESPDMVFTSFKGLTVDELEDLRVELYENDARYKVVKNRLAKRAFREVVENGTEETAPASSSDDGTISSGEDVELSDISGVGPSKVEALEETGIKSVRDVVEADLESLTEAEGVGESTAENIQAAAEELIPGDAGGSEQSSEDTASGDRLDDIDDFLRGNTGIVFSGNGFVNTAKVVTDFSEEHENLEIKGGLMEGSILDEDAVEEISELPTRRELLTQLASSLNSPIQALASFLNYPIQSLVNSLNEVKDQKDE